MFFLGQTVEILKGLEKPSTHSQLKTVPPIRANGERQQEQSPSPWFPSSRLQSGLVEHAAGTC